MSKTHIIEYIKNFNENGDCYISNHKYYNLHLTKDMYIYNIYDYHYSHLIFYKNDLNFISRKNILSTICSIINSNKIIYFCQKNIEQEEKDKKIIYSFEMYNYTGKLTNFFCFSSDKIKQIFFSENAKFAVTVDIFGTVNLYCTQSFKVIDTIDIKYFNSIDNIYISPDGKTVLFTKNNLIVIWKNKKLTTIPLHYKQINRCYRGFFNVHFENDVIKLGFFNGSVIILKDGKIIKKIIRNLRCISTFFSPDGKMVYIFSKGQITFIHEDSDEYSNEFSIIKKIKSNGKISIDGKLFIVQNSISGKFLIYDLSFIGHKKVEKLEFLLSSTKKDTSINSFFENDLFDINVVKLIFDFLPFSKKINQEKMLVN